MAKSEEASLLMRFDAQHRLYFALGVTAVVFFLIWNKVSVPALIMISWASCATVIIILNWLIIFTAHPREMRQIARLKDSSRISILLFVITASCVSLFAIIFLLLNHGKDGQHVHVTRHVLMSIGSVATSWFMLHTMFT